MFFFGQGQPMKLWLPEPTPQQQLDTLDLGFWKDVTWWFSAAKKIICVYV